MKRLNVLLLAGLMIFSLNSCKKGCIDPYAKNYNSKKKKDNGSCTYYSTVTLHSIDVKKIPSKNSNGHLWDDGLDNDTDNDNSYPDLYVWFKAEGGYSLKPTIYYETIDPLNVNINFTLDPVLSTDEWKNDKGFWVYFEEVDYNNGAFYEPIDSVLVKPFDKNGSTDAHRFRDTLQVVDGEIEFTANMSWND